MDHVMGISGDFLVVFFLIYLRLCFMLCISFVDKQCGGMQLTTLHLIVTQYFIDDYSDTFDNKQKPNYVKISDWTI